jgi:UDP:flavonoid glycosyltransferase YjiC (YdhE family)
MHMFTNIHRNGVPQIVLPMWLDLYDYATRVEWLGVGVWGNKVAAPDWKAEELSSAFLKVLADDEEARAIRQRAEQLGDLFRDTPGQDCAAEELAKLARW